MKFEAIFPNILTKIVISRKKIKENVLDSEKVHLSRSERDCAATSSLRRTWLGVSLLRFCAPGHACGGRDFSKPSGA
jgi:hypothetical protein